MTFSHESERDTQRPWAGRGISGTRKVARARHISGISWQPGRWSSKINPFSDAETALVATTKEPAGGFCEPGTGSSINSCLQRSSRLPANFNGPLTHADRRFLTSRDASPSSSFLFSCPSWPARPDTVSFPRDHAILLPGGYKISVSVIFKVPWRTGGTTKDSRVILFLLFATLVATRVTATKMASVESRVSEYLPRENISTLCTCLFGTCAAYIIYDFASQFAILSSYFLLS